MSQASTVAVVGGGIMGRGIATALALAEHHVAVVETDGAAAAQLVESVASGLRSDGSLAATTIAAALGRIRVESTLGPAVSDATLVIEAVPEVMAIKAELWQRLGSLAGPHAILASNTSALDIDALAALVPHPERVLGTHWFNPAHVVPCVEVVRGALTGSRAIDSVMSLLAAAGKQPVVVKNSPGFVANRIQFALVREALLCAEEGIASADDIDRIVSSSFGARLAVLGPLANADLGGLDTYRWILEFLESQFGDRFAPPQLLVDAVDAGRLGVKAGEGIAQQYSNETAAALTRRRDTTLRRVIAAVDERNAS